MRGKRLMALGVFLLMGCSGGVFSKGGYPEAVQGCLEATQTWIDEPKSRSKLNRARSLCEATEKEFAQSQESRRYSYSELHNLKGCLETAKTVLDDGGDPVSLGSFGSISPLESVRNEVGMVKNKLEAEVDAAARASASPAP